MVYDARAARRYGMALAALVLFCAVVPVAMGMVQLSRRPAYAANAGWPMFLGNDARTGFNSEETYVNPTTVPKLQVLWKFSTGGRINAQPVVANGDVYFGSWDGKEYATDLSGKQLWNAPIGGQTANCSPPDVFGVGSTPTVAEVKINQSSTAVLFVGGKDPISKIASLYALNAADGTTLWETPLSTTSSSFTWSSPVLYNGSVYVGLSSVNDCPLVRGALVQLDAATGAAEHTFYTVPNGCIGASIWSSPAINDSTGKIFVTTGNNGSCSSTETYAQAVIELNTSDLSYVDSWQVPPSQHRVDSDFGATPTLFSTTFGSTAHDMVGVVNKNGTYYALDQNSMHRGPVWQDTISTSTISISSSAWDGSMLYVAGRNTTIGGKSCRGSLRALNPANGSFVWQDCLNDGNVLAAVSAVPGVVFVGEGPHLLATDAATGHILLNAVTNGILYGASSISNGTVYVGTNAGTLYAFVTPNAPTPSPTVGMTPSATAGTTLAQDTFIRPDQTLWGTATDGQTWGADANARNAFTIAQDSGQVLGGPSTTGSYTAVLGPTLTGAQVLVSGSLGNFSGNTLGDVLHWSNGNNFYKAYITGSLLVISKKVNGVITKLSSIAFGSTAGVSYTLLFSISGSNVAASAWPTSGSPPGTWMLTSSDSSLSSGKCGVLLYLASGAMADITLFQATSVS